MLANAGLLNTQDEVHKAWPSADLTYLRAEHTFLRPQIVRPPLKPPMSDDVLVLPESPEDQWQDRSFAHTVAQRCTVYEYSDMPINRAQVSEFLACTLKVQAYLQGQDYDSTMRPYASAGEAYELEAYLFIDHCTGIATGFYHYDPGHHALKRLPLSDEVKEIWIKEARRATNHQLDRIQILLFFTVRIGHIHWKSRPLALSYTNLGRLRQTYYRRWQQQEAQLAGSLLSGVQAFDTIKASGAEDDMLVRWIGLQSCVINQQQTLGCGRCMSVSRLSSQNPWNAVLVGSDLTHCRVTFRCSMYPLPMVHTVSGKTFRLKCHRVHLSPWSAHMAGANRPCCVFCSALTRCKQGQLRMTGSHLTDSISKRCGDSGVLCCKMVRCWQGISIKTSIFLVR